MAVMALSEALLALNGYSPPTPIPNTNKLKLMTGNNTDGLEDKRTLDNVMQMAPDAMNEAVKMLPRRLPMVFAKTPNKTIPIMTPVTTEYVILL
jgi:hypothetical protein